MRLISEDGSSLEPLGLFDVNGLKEGEFVLDSGKYATGTKYGPLLTDNHSYLCPDCGGYGEYNKKTCGYCQGNGTIPLNDIRVVDVDPRDDR